MAVTLWHLASRNVYRTVASTFGIRKSTAVEITKTSIHPLNELFEDWITFAAPVQETGEAIQQFSNNNLFNIPQILGAINGSHIPIMAPKHNKDSHFNRICFYSMNLPVFQPENSTWGPKWPLQPIFGGQICQERANVLASF